MWGGFMRGNFPQEVSPRPFKNFKWPAGSTCGRAFLWGLPRRRPHAPKNFEKPAGSTCGRGFLWGLPRRSPHTPKNFQWPAGFTCGRFLLWGDFPEEVPPHPFKNFQWPADMSAGGFFVDECIARRAVRAYIGRSMIHLLSVRQPHLLLFPRQTAFGAPSGDPPTGQGEWGVAGGEKLRRLRRFSPPALHAVEGRKPSVLDRKHTQRYDNCHPPAVSPRAGEATLLTACSVSTVRGTPPQQKTARR